MDNKLTQAQLKAMLDYSPLTGVFTWKEKISRKVVVGSVAGCYRADGYLRIKALGQEYLGHRVAFFYMNGYWPSAEIDHKDGNPANNTWDNLRECIHAENLQNARPRKSASGVTGVGWHKLRQKWRATLTVMGKQVHAGLFDTKSEAIEARSRLKANLHTFNPIPRSGHVTQ